MSFEDGCDFKKITNGNFKRQDWIVKLDNST
jgi:hypothetical protein